MSKKSSLSSLKNKTVKSKTVISSQNKIGLFDWGTGGLSVLKPLLKKHPSLDFTYLSDSGSKPYGQQSASQLQNRLKKIIRFFKSQDIQTVIIACNAASTELPALRKAFPEMQLHGMLEAGEEILKKSKKKNLVVLGGRKTIESQYFQNSFSKQLRNNQLSCLVAQPLSALIEKGKANSDEFAEHVQQLQLNALEQFETEADAVLLACTHYPAALKIFKAHFKKAVILDPAEQVVKNLKLSVVRKKSVSTNKQAGRTTLNKNLAKSFLTTGSVTESNQTAQKAFKMKTAFKKVAL